MRTSCWASHPFTSSVLLIVNCALLTAAAQVPNYKVRPHYSVVVPGLEYANVRLTNVPWSVHVARLDRSRRDLGVMTTLGKGRIQGLSALSAQTVSVPPKLGKPVAAVNGDFFLIKPGPYQGDPEGLQIVNGELVSAPGDLSFWAESGGALHVGKVSAQMQFTWPDGTQSPLGLNETPRRNGATLFAPIFGASTQASNAVELVLEHAQSGPWLPLRANQLYSGRVREIRTSGNTSLSPETVILSLTGTATNALASVKPGALLTFTTALSPNLGEAVTAIGGGPLLVERGKAQEWPVQRGTNTYLLPRHPRTALGFNSRYFYLVVADGRQQGLSMGMSFAELATFMKKLGCTEAMNLDGGGSATFWLAGKVMNSPSDKRERSLANAVMIVQRTNRKR